MADPNIAGENSQRYYLHVAKTMGASDEQLDEFFRFYRISGNGHCSSGGEGAWEFGQQLHETESSVPSSSWWIGPKRVSPLTPSPEPNSTTTTPARESLLSAATAGSLTALRTREMVSTPTSPAAGHARRSTTGRSAALVHFPDSVKHLIR